VDGSPLLEVWKEGGREGGREGRGCKKEEEEEEEAYIYTWQREDRGTIEEEDRSLTQSQMTKKTTKEQPVGIEREEKEDENEEEEDYIKES